LCQIDPAARLVLPWHWLAAGLEGIEQGIDPGDPHLDNMYLKSDAELKVLGVKRLPKRLMKLSMRSKPTRFPSRCLVRSCVILG
jgi:glutamine synthetase